MIWHNRKIVFIHIPKCGGTSVRKAIQKKIPGKHQNRTWVRGWKTQVGNLWNQHATYDRYSLTVPKEYKYIAQVRNPFDRFESMGKHMTRQKFTDTPFNEWGINAIDGLKEGHWKACFDKKLPGHISDPSVLFKPQWQWVRDDVIIFKMEDKVIWKFLDLPEENLNVSNTKGEWSSELYKKVADFYEKDFEEFRY